MFRWLIFSLLAIFFFALAFSVSATFLPLTTLMAIGQQGAHITQLQQMLAQDGVYLGAPTGFYDSATVNAVKQFQAKYNIPKVSGIRG